MSIATTRKWTQKPELTGVDLDLLFIEEQSRRLPARERTGPCIIAVGGGKGGIGKTVVSALISMTLAKLGHETVLIDADFAGANLHGYLKTFDPEKSLRNFLERKTDNINELAMPTHQDHLRLITGSPGIATYEQLTYAAKQKLLRNIRNINAVFAVLDLGAGSTYTNLDFFLIADHPIILATCDSLSLQDAYGFVRVGLFRKLQKTNRSWPELFAQFITLGNISVRGDITTVDQFLQEYQTSYPAICSFLRREIAAFHTCLLINNLDPNDDQRKSQTFRLVAHRILGLTIENWGDIRRDEIVREAITHLKPELLLDGSAAEDVERIVRDHLLNPLGLREENPPTEFQPSNRICTFKCVAWNDCKKKVGGMPCTRIP